MTDLPFEAAKRLSPYMGLSVYAIIPFVAESHNLTLFAYKPCDVVFVLF